MMNLLLIYFLISNKTLAIMKSLIEYCALYKKKENTRKTLKHIKIKNRKLLKSKEQHPLLTLTYKLNTYNI